jgi:hypothetical protein
MELLRLANLVDAGLLCGLIWTIQLVHYPLFAAVGAGAWTDYEREHQRRITVLVAPLMVANVALAAAVLLAGGPDAALRGLDAALALAVFTATGTVYSGLHRRLGGGWDATLGARLVRLNWWRTAAWSAQTAIAALIVARAA